MLPMAALGIGAGVAQGVGGLAGWFRKNKNPAKASNDYLNQIPGAANPYYQPYIDAGKNAQDQLNPQYTEMAGNSGAYLNKLGEGYKESPGYQFKLNQALQAGGNAAAAGGMLGSPQHQQQSMQLGNDIASQDYNDYINHVLGVAGAGQQGLERTSVRGYDASTGYGDLKTSVLNQQARNAYSGAANENAARSNDWSNIFGGAGGALAGYLSRNYKPANPMQNYGGY